MRKMKIKHKMLILNITLLSIFGITIFLFVFVKMFSSFSQIRNNVYTFFLHEKQRNLENMVTLAYGIIKDEYENSNLGEKEKKENVKRKLSSLRYSGGTGYFFAYELTDDNKALFAFHATQPELNNKPADLNILDKNPDFSKRKMFRTELISKAKNGGGFVFYYYDKFDDKHFVVQKNVLKLSYGRLFEPWGWVVVSGVYIDDIESRFDKITRYVMGQRNFAKMIMFAITIFLIIVSYFFINTSSNSVDKVINNIKKRIDRLHIGDIYNEDRIENEKTSVELDEISESLDSFICTIREELLKKSHDNDLIYPEEDILPDILTGSFTEHSEGVTNSMHEIADIMDDMHQRYINSGLTDEYAEKLKEKILDLIKSEKLYLDNSLSISVIAKKLDCNSSYISQVLNECLNTNFRDLVSMYRINEFKSRVNDILDKKENILSLAFECGFRSKSSFNSAFKRHMGKTPRDYINDLARECMAEV